MHRLQVDIRYHIGRKRMAKREIAMSRNLTHEEAVFDAVILWVQWCVVAVLFGMAVGLLVKALS